eukprot:3424375-Prorocentrum_lima.AAC.1
MARTVHELRVQDAAGDGDSIVPALPFTAHAHARRPRSQGCGRVLKVAARLTPSRPEAILG